MNNQNPLIGIIIPTYNRKALLKRALDSVIAQTYTNWTVCVVDDGSIDETEHMMKDYSDIPNIHYIKQSQNQGVNAARNTALEYLIKEEKCDFITLLDDDDYFDIDALSEAQKKILQYPQEKWFVSKKVTEEMTPITQPATYGPMPYINYYLSISMQGDATHVIASSLIGDLHFSKQFKQAQEWTFFMQLSKRSEMFVYDYASTICTYLEDGLSAQATSSKKRKSSEEVAVEALQAKILMELGYKPATIESLKLQDRIQKTLASKKYHKLLRYIPRYLYWKAVASLT